jgi:hypothetical protein
LPITARKATKLPSSDRSCGSQAMKRMSVTLSSARLGTAATVPGRSIVASVLRSSRSWPLIWKSRMSRPRSASNWAICPMPTAGSVNPTAQGSNRRRSGQAVRRPFGSIRRRSRPAPRSRLSDWASHGFGPCVHRRFRYPSPPRSAERDRPVATRQANVPAARKRHPRPRIRGVANRYRRRDSAVRQSTSVPNRNAIGASNGGQDGQRLKPVAVRPVGCRPPVMPPIDGSA